jgi:hypothetical protein
MERESRLARRVRCAGAIASSMIVLAACAPRRAVVEELTPGAPPSEASEELAPSVRALPAAVELDTRPPLLRLVNPTPAPNAALLIEADEALHERALQRLRCRVRDSGGNAPCELELAAERWIAVHPRGRWSPRERHVLVLEEVSDRAGNAAPRFEVPFETGALDDRSAPHCEPRLLDLEPEQAREVLVASRGLSIALRSDELLHPGRSRVRILAPVTWDGVRRAPRTELPRWFDGPAEALRYEPPRELELARGRVRLEVVACDLAGNCAAPQVVVARVTRLDERERPFAARQVIHLDFASDRSPLGRSDGRADWREDLERFGLTSAGDPLGIEEELARELAERVRERVQTLLEAAPRERLELRLEAPPLGAHARLCIGGSDPSLPRRDLGSPSSGLLGRSTFDARNAEHDEQCCRLAPALGVFPGELFHAEARSARRAGGTTLFARLFAPLAPELGGTPFGAHPLDARLLDPRFDPARASPAERERAEVVERAAQHLALAVGALVAHELGHMLGLVEPDPLPRGLEGSRGFHGAAAHLMSGELDFERLADPALELGALERAYLGERIHLR